MLLSETAMVKWHNRNKQHYIDKGYKYTKIGDEFTVKVEDLMPTNRSMVKIKCDYCGKEYDKEYFAYLRAHKPYIIKKDACTECIYKKRNEILQYNISNNLLNENDCGYWMDRQNRLKELAEYIKANRTLINMINNKWGKAIYRSFYDRGESIEDAVEELGFDIKKLKNRVSYKYYEEINNIIIPIKHFIDSNKRFPSEAEIIKELNISYKALLTQYNGIAGIKKIMQYSDADDLIDDNGWLNKSRYEYIVSQYLIHNTNIDFKREQYPFKQFSPDILYQSDFAFYPNENDSVIHVEVWGGAKIWNNQNKYYDYDEVMEKKLALYKQYNINLISIYPNVFYNSIKKIQESLYDIFKPYMQLKYKKIDDKYLIVPSKLTDGELLDELLKYSTVKNVLPSEYALRKIGKSNLFTQVLKRYDSYEQFAKRYNVYTASMVRNN